MIVEKGYETIQIDNGVTIQTKESLEEKYKVVPNPVATVSAWIQIAVGTIIVFSTIPSLILQIWAYELGLIAVGIAAYVVFTLSRKFTWKKSYLSAILSGEIEDNR